MPMRYFVPGKGFVQNEPSTASEQLRRDQAVVKSNFRVITGCPQKRKRRKLSKGEKRDSGLEKSKFEISLDGLQKSSSEDSKPPKRLLEKSGLEKSVKPELANPALQPAFEKSDLWKRGLEESESVLDTSGLHVAASDTPELQKSGLGNEELNTSQLEKHALSESEACVPESPKPRVDKPLDKLESRTPLEPSNQAEIINSSPPNEVSSSPAPRDSEASNTQSETATKPAEPSMRLPSPSSPKPQIYTTKVAEAPDSAPSTDGPCVTQIWGEKESPNQASRLRLAPGGRRPQQNSPHRVHQFMVGSGAVDVITAQGTFRAYTMFTLRHNKFELRNASQSEEAWLFHISSRG